jgi:hypothetical protein
MKLSSELLEIKRAVEKALGYFIDELPFDWAGKEHDAVSRFVMRYLINECEPGAALYAPAQIGIEIPVAKPVSLDRQKPSSWKDVVIWSEPGMTAFDQELKPVQFPAAVIEWKVHFKNGRSKAKLTEEIYKDHDWLSAFTDEHEESIGYSVFLETIPEHQLSVECFYRGNRSQLFVEDELIHQ